MSNNPKYYSKFHPAFFDMLDGAAETMTEEEFSLFYELLLHERNILERDPYNNSRECKYGILHEQGFRTMTFHSKIPRIGTGDMRIIFQVDEGARIIFYFSVGKRINTTPRPTEDIYSKTDSILKHVQEQKRPSPSNE